MSVNYSNYLFQLTQFNPSSDSFSQSSSEHIKGNMNDKQFINFFERNTNDNTNEAKKGDLDKKNDNGIHDIEISNNIEKNSLGRKRKGDSKQKTNHSKYSHDNSIRKIKRIIISELLKFLNKKIKDIYGDDIGGGMVEKRLMKLNQKQIADASVEFNLNFLNKTLKDIFSEKVTGRITNFSLERNKEIIQELINEKDEEKRKYFQGLFNITFLECLKYFRGNDINNEYLKGLTKLSEIEGELEEKEGKVYVSHIKKFLEEYEEKLFRKKPRKK